MKNEVDCFYTRYAVALTFLLKDHPQAVLILQYILWRKGAETSHADRKWHFQVADIARRLGKDDRTVRKHLRPLVELGLFRLCGEAGKQYYVFEDSRYAEILSMDPRSLMNATPSTGREAPHTVPGEPLPQDARTPLPHYGRVENKEEKIAEQCSPVGLDGTEPILVPEESSSVSLGSPQGAPAAPNGASVARIATDILKQPPRGLPPSGSGSPSMGGALPRADGGNSISANGRGSAAACALPRPSGPERAHRDGATPPSVQRQQCRPVYGIRGQAIPLPLPPHIDLRPCAKRQDAIVRELNDGGFSFVKETPMGSDFDGYRVCAYDTNNKVILLTADDGNFANVSYVQEMCARFIPQGWKVFLWSADDQCLHLIAKSMASGTDAAEQGREAA